MPFYAHHKHSITLWFHDRCRLMPMLNKGGPTFMSRLNVVTNIYYFFPPVKGGHWIWLLIVDNRMEIARLGMHQLGLFQASFPPLFFIFSNMILLLSCGGWYQWHCPAFLDRPHWWCLHRMIYAATSWDVILSCIHLAFVIKGSTSWWVLPGAQGSPSTPFFKLNSQLPTL